MMDGPLAKPKPLKAPFPWFGGKSRVAPAVWAAFGDVRSYVEPFFGSGAVLLGRPNLLGVETVNDVDGFVANFWRALAADPDGVAREADWPVNENDLHARHVWMVGQRGDLTARLEGDPGFYDVRIAGWWVWGVCAWVGQGWCSGKGPWRSEGGRFVNGGVANGVHRQLPHISDAGRGVHRKLPHISSAGLGVHRKLSHISDCGMGINAAPDLLSWMRALAARMRRVRVCCGDWSRIMGPSPTIHPGVPCGVFLDPPYGIAANRVAGCYSVDSLSVAADVRAWCVEHGGDERLRIALCGYDGEHNDLESLGWQVHAWKARGGYGNQGNARGRENATRERIWFSPGCLAGGRLI